MKKILLPLFFATTTACGIVNEMEETPNSLYPKWNPQSGFPGTFVTRFAIGSDYFATLDLSPVTLFYETTSNPSPFYELHKNSTVTNYIDDPGIEEEEVENIRSFLRERKKQNISTLCVYCSLLNEKNFENFTNLIIENFDLDNLQQLFISDLSSYKELLKNIKKENLKSLELSSCNINISDIPKNILKSIETLVIRNGSLNESLNLENLTKLINLNLSSDEIEKIEGLESLSNLKSLKLNKNQIEKIESLESLTNLKSLELISNQIKKIEGLEGLVKLQALWLGKNQIKKIEGLESLTNLENLYLDDNRIEKIEGLENLSNLKTLYLSSNQIKKMEGLESLTNLNNLYLVSNQIKKIEGLEKNNKLLTLDTNYNYIIL